MAIYHQEGILISRIPEEDLHDLIHTSSGPAVSIFLPTQRVGIHFKKDQIRLKNLLTQAEKELSNLGYRSLEISKILKPAWDLHQNSLFWSHQGEGLVIYIAPDVFHYYRLPFSVKEFVSVGKRFYIKPLLVLLAHDWKFYLLTLSQKGANLFQGSPYHLEKIESILLPQGIGDTAQEEPRSHLSFHSLGQGGKAMFYGHGGLNEDLKGRIIQYFQKIDKSVNDFLKDDHSPLILAGVEYFFPMYQKVNNYPRLLENMVHGNPDRMNPKRLHDEAWSIISLHFEHEKDQDLESYRKLSGTGRTSNDIAEIVKAARQGKVNILFVSSNQKIWGRLNEDTNEVLIRQDDPEPEDTDLLDLTASLVFKHKQKIHVLESREMPDAHSLSAILHY